MWEAPVDVTALDPDDPGVADEVARRLASGELEVAEGNLPYKDPLRLKPSVTADQTRWWTAAFLVMTGLYTVIFVLNRAAWWCSGSLIVMLVVTLIVAVRFRVFSSTPSKRQVKAEVKRQVHLAQMARRNACWYRAVDVPGDSLFPTSNPVRTDSLLKGLVTHGVYAVGDDFCSGSINPKKKNDAARPPAEWGNFSVYVRTKGKSGDDYTTSFRGWYMMAALPRVVPHIIIDAKSDNRFGLDHVISLDSNQCVPMDPDFDSRFTVYAPNGYEDDARDLISTAVRQELLAVGDDMNVELVDNAVIFFKSGPLDWNDSSSWFLVGQLRALVQEAMYPRIGEYVDGHVRAPAKKKRQEYELLSDKLPAAKIADQGKVLKPRIDTWKLLVFAVLFLGAIFLFTRFLNSLSGFQVVPILFAVAWVLDMIAIIRPRLRHRPAQNRTLR